MTFKYYLYYLSIRINATALHTLININISIKHRSLNISQNGENVWRTIHSRFHMFARTRTRTRTHPRTRTRDKFLYSPFISVGVTHEVQKSGSYSQLVTKLNSIWYFLDSRFLLRSFFSFFFYFSYVRRWKIFRQLFTIGQKNVNLINNTYEIDKVHGTQGFPSSRESISIVKNSRAFL